MVIAISYGHYVNPMASERWKNDVAYAMTPFKLLAWPIGVWPLQVYNVYALIRCILATCCMVRSRLMSILTILVAWLFEDVAKTTVTLTSQFKIKLRSCW